MAQEEGPKHIVAKLVCTSTFFVFALVWYSAGIIPAVIIAGLLFICALSYMITRAKAKAVKSVTGEGDIRSSQIDAMREIWLKKYGYICKEGSAGYNIIKFLLTNEKTRQYFVASEVKWLTDSFSLMAPYAVIRVRTRRDEGKDDLETEEIPSLIKFIAAGIYKYAPVTYLTYDSILKEQKVAFPFFFIFYNVRQFARADGSQFSGVDKEITLSVEALVKVEQGFNLSQLHKLARVDISPGLPIRSEAMSFAERNTPGRFKIRAPGMAVEPEQKAALIAQAGGACQACGAKADEGAALDVVQVEAGAAGPGGLTVLCASCRKAQAVAQAPDPGAEPAPSAPPVPDPF